MEPHHAHTKDLAKSKLARGEIARKGATAMPKETGMETEFDRVVDSLPGLVWTSTTDGDVDFLNRRWLEYTGLVEDEEKGIGWQAALHPDDAPAALQFWRERVGAGVAGEFEARLRRSDGAYRWFQCRFDPLTDDSGKSVRWCGINTDIEDRKRIEAELNRVNSRFNHAQQISHVGSFWSDLEADEHLWSDELYRIFELDPATFKITIQTVRDHVHPDDLSRFDALVAQSWGGEGYSWAFRIMPKPNVVKHLHSYCRRVTEITDRLVFFGTIQDVTEFKRVEDALRQSEAFLAEGEAVSGTGSFLWRLESGDITWSSQLYRIFEFEDGSR